HNLQESHRTAAIPKNRLAEAIGALRAGAYIEKDGTPRRFPPPRLRGAPHNRGPGPPERHPSRPGRSRARRSRWAGPGGGPVPRRSGCSPRAPFDMARCTHRFLAEPAGAVLLGNPGDATAIGAVEPVRYFFRASG